MTAAKFNTLLREAERRHDVSIKLRVEWIRQAQDCMATTERQKMQAKMAIQRVKRQSKRPKYPVFFSIQPLIKMAFETRELTSTEELLDTLILQLRLTTMMRSADLANIVWGLFHLDGKHYLKTTDKNGQQQTLSVQGHVLQCLALYIHRHLDIPAQHLFRYVKDPHCTLGSERLAKRLLVTMEKAGINTEHFKAHSLRGATASHLLNNVDKHLVQSRGGWTSSRTLDSYYNRLHQDIDWQEALTKATGEDAGTEASLNSALHRLKVALTIPTKEGRSGATEGGCNALIRDLAARGVCRELYNVEDCPACGGMVQHEAAYICPGCKKTLHVRCLAPVDHPQQQQPKFHKKCLLCVIKDTRVQKDDDLIVDVMGVCS